jgi:hypothetical protein
MRKLLLATAILAATAAPSLTAQSPAQPPNLSGNWQGTLQPDKDHALHIVLKIAANDGKYRGQLYSIDQGAGAFAISSLSLRGAEVDFAIQPTRATVDVIVIDHVDHPSPN